MEPIALFSELKGHLDPQKSSLPLYKQLGGAIEQAIRANRLKRGAVLPGERTLSEALGISRVTVRKAIEGLVEAGLLQRRHGSKTAVSSPVEKLAVQP